MKLLTCSKLLLLLIIIVAGLASCDNEEKTEHNLPGEWYTSEKINFGAYAWGRGGTVMTFNENHQGTIGSKSDRNYLVFEWRWINEGYNLMELHFYNDRSYAYISDAEAGVKTFNGIWYNSRQDYRDKRNKQPFHMLRQ